LPHWPISHLLVGTVPAYQRTIAQRTGCTIEMMSGRWAMGMCCALTMSPFCALTMSPFCAVLQL